MGQNGWAHGHHHPSLSCHERRKKLEREALEMVDGVVVVVVVVGVVVLSLLAQARGE
jgi:hypothetical protein